MKEYTVKKASYKLGIDDAAWEKVPAVELKEGWWEQYPKKFKTLARLVHCDEGLILRMETDEWPITVKTMTYNSEVCLDSCMEFFFTPNDVDRDFINIEASAASVPLCYIGEDRYHRKGLNPIKEGLRFRTLIEYEKGWMLYIFVPFTFLKKYFSKVGPEMRLNFYKCGDETDVVHYNVWNKIETEEPDYHRPEYFGKALLSDKEI